MNALTTTTAAITMTSLELVEFINADRTEALYAPKLLHFDFMKKVPKVLGEGAGKFSDTHVHPQNGQQYPCYRFPKREACLMAMSYSYALQAKVFDRMTALEAQQAPALPNFTDPAEAAIAWAGQYRIAKEAEARAEQFKEHLALVAPKVTAFDTLMHDRKDTLAEVARTIPGVNSRAIRGALVGVHLYKRAGRLRVYRNGFSDKLFFEGHEDAYGEREIFVHPKGKAELVRLANAGVLPMLKGHCPVLTSVAHR